MLAEYSIAAGAVGAVALRPQSRAATAVASALAAADIGSAGPRALEPALAAAWPMVTLLAGALVVSALAVRFGAVDRTAAALARGSAGSSRRLYLLICALAGGTTAVLTLDGAVVLLAPVVVALDRRYGAPRRPLLLGLVAVSNAFSAALPSANPTNLVVLARLGLSPWASSARLLPPAALAAVLCAGAVLVAERAALAARLHGRSYEGGAAGTPLAALGPVVRIALQISSLLVVLLTVVPRGRVHAAGLVPTLGLALSVAALAAVANNLPASAIAAVVLTPGAGYPALVGLSVGALATPHGSVATLLAGELAHERPHARFLAAVALVATAAAAALVWAGG
jgi:Na+/H+ antiporter NhaD/arsenite permease-like protein